MSFIRTVMLVMIFMFPQVSPANAQDSNWSFNLSSGFYSDYMFRGFNLYDGVSIQPSATVAHSFGEFGVLSGNVWAHLSAEGDRQDEKFTEVDYTLNYSVSLGILELGVGHIWFTFPRDDDMISDTAEFFGSLSVDTFLNPSLSVYHDYQDFDAQYYELGLSHTLECSYLGEGFNITPFVNFGFASNAEKVYEDSSGLVQVTYGAYFDLALGDIAVSPSLNYTSQVDDATQNEFWIGVAFNYDI